MHRYRVYIVPKTGRFAPLLTVLVDADTREEALVSAQDQCARTKAVSAEDISERRKLIPEQAVGSGTSGPRLWNPEVRLHSPSL